MDNLGIDGLNRRFGLGKELVFKVHPSGLVMADLQTSQCTGEFFLQGAHVTRYQPNHQTHPVLFMSQQALYTSGKALRGGIPICFPWFNSHPSDPSLPAHGWARTSVWNLVQTQKVDGRIEVDLGLAKDGFDLIYRISMGDTLQVSLEVRSRSTRREPKRRWYGIRGSTNPSAWPISVILSICRCAASRRRTFAKSPFA